MKRNAPTETGTQLVAPLRLNIISNLLHPFTNMATMATFTLSNFMLSLPTNLVLVSDNAKTVSYILVAPAERKPAKQSRWSEGKASASAPKAPASSVRSRTRNLIWNDKPSFSMPLKAPQQISPIAVEKVSRAV
jgi:hypothetical protein